ncbi:hypothetical protein EON65_07455 [archaeon]|nr:MAG: hypothetical protein EON65_07455 [archaeon]
MRSPVCIIMYVIHTHATYQSCTLQHTSQSAHPHIITCVCYVCVSLYTPPGRSAHMPRTALLLGGDTSVDLGFSWLLSPPALLAKHLEFHDLNTLVKALSE